MDPRTFFTRAQFALGFGTQSELGDRLRISKRTAQRFASSGIPQHYLKDLALLVHPVDAGLATEIAASMGHTPVSLGIVAPVVAVAPPAAPAPPAPPPPDGIVDAVVCAAAEAMEMMPRDVRPALLAAFKRAREIGVTVDMVERVLLASIPAPPAPQPVSSAKRSR